MSIIKELLIFLSSSIKNRNIEIEVFDWIPMPYQDSWFKNEKKYSYDW